MILFDVVRRFDEACKILIERRLIALPEGVPNEELLRFLKEHPNRNKVLENVCDQVSRFEKGFKKTKQDAKRVHQIMAGCAQLYVVAILEHRRQENLSHAEKTRLANEGGLKKELESIVQESTRVISQGQREGTRQGR